MAEAVRPATIAAEEGRAPGARVAYRHGLKSCSLGRRAALG